MFPTYSGSESDTEGYVFSHLETQGWRPNMEDAVLSQKIKNYQTGEVDHIFAVFDGHGGANVAIICKFVFPKVLKYNLKQESNEVDGVQWIKDNLRKSVMAMDDLL